MQPIFSIIVTEASWKLGLANITLNDMILFSFPTLKSQDLMSFLNDTIHYFHHVNLGIAVDTNRA